MDSALMGAEAIIVLFTVLAVIAAVLEGRRDD